MQRRIAAALVALVLPLGVVSSALARELARGTTKVTILKALDGPSLATRDAQCSSVWTVSLRAVQQGDEITCRDGGLNSVPVEVQAALLACPH